ncbi:4Fe-4S binding protein [Chakrabartyella piscis]|uniref:nucleotide-binding protein n=1 Tax=Chakrabartyella piscis TaxID=2918914 RepID=UPI002958C8AF|nr:4Fe-4S binding protein [Chakrabartyella piscis]
MKIACLSGKGGAGKTFVAVNLAAAVETCTYIDCDVEEPNGRLFWKPEEMQTESVSTLLPQFDVTKCNGCKKCVEFCKFHALVYIKEKPMVFSEVCHNCGGCQIVCPEGAVSEVEKPVGIIEIGHHNHVKVVTGILNTGEASGVGVIKSALQKSSEMTILDCPPGSACSVMETVMDVDYCVLVAEPTAFGFHNVKMVYELVTLLGKPCGMVINKETEPYTPLEDFCKEKNIPILERILYNPVLAKYIADGEIVAEMVPSEKKRFATILEKIGGVL